MDGARPRGAVLTWFPPALFVGAGPACGPSPPHPLGPEGRQVEGWTAALSPWSLGRAASSGGCGAFSHLSPAPAGMDGVAAVALAGPRSRGPVQPCGGLAGQTQVTQRLQTARQETGHLRRKHGFFGLWRESVTHRGSRNQQATRGGVFPTQTKRRTGTMGLGEPAGAGLPENRPESACQTGLPWSSPPA